MATTQSIIQRAFAGGELAPALHARADTAKYQTGLRRCRNFIVQRHGGVSNRGGTRFVNPCKTTSINVKLLRYVSEIEGESVLIEIGNAYIRFYLNGALVVVDPGDVDAWDVGTDYVIGDLVIDGGVVYYALEANIGSAPPAAEWHAFDGDFTYELPSAFAGNLPNWHQSGRTITFTHRLAHPYELRYESITRWVLQQVDTGTQVPAPVGVGLAVGVVGTGHAGYVVTAAALDTYEESVASAQVVSAGADPPTAANPNVISWTAQPAAAEFYIYSDPVGNGTYGFIGTAAGAGVVQFKDPGIVPDYTLTPPIPRVLFNTAGEYPHVSATHQQRRMFGQTVNNPDAIYASRIGLPSNFQISQPLQDDDALTLRLAGNNHHAVRHMLALKQLIVMSGAGEWTVGEPKVPLTPSTLSADQEVYTGCSEIPPCVIGNSVIYVQARGVGVRDLQFNQQVEGFGGRDLSIFAAHLFNGFSLREIDYAEESNSILWACRSDGTLLGLTYIRDQEVWGWHRHDTGASGRFEHVCVVPELNEDAVYVIVRRTIDGSTVRYIERLEPHRENVAAADFDLECFFVDCGLSYDGAPANNITGMLHLEGQVIAVVGDGAVIFNGDPAAVNAADFTVDNTGALPTALPASYSRIHAGLAIRFAEIETLDLDVAGEDVRDKKKRDGSVTLLLEDSARTFKIGPSSANLIGYALKPNEQAADQFTGQAEMNIGSTFTENGRLFIRHSDPLPLTILAIIPNVELGG
jgi:hypothetical protein